MKRVLLTVSICLLSLLNYSQDEITIDLKKAYQSGEYDLIISEHSDKIKNYPAKAIYYVGMAYYMKSEDEKAIKTMDLSIKKDKLDPAPHFIKGITLNYMSEYEKAIKSFKKAIELDSKNTHFYSGLGDSYFELKKYEKALVAYTKSTQQTDPIDRPFTMIPQIYANTNEPEKALKAFYTSKETISKKSDSYINALYNIGLYELLNKQYDKSETAYLELIELEPNDFHSYAKLIQIYYGKKEYEKAKPYREILYNAYDQGILKDDLRNMFCFDQFEWNNKLVQVFERFAVEEGELYYKHLFYVVNKKGEIEYRIQTENSPIAEELGSGKYAIGMDKDGTHSTFGFIEENFDYENLKSIVIQILDKEIKAAASSRVGK